MQTFSFTLGEPQTIEEQRLTGPSGGPVAFTLEEAKVLIMVTITVFIEKESEGKGTREYSNSVAW